MKDRLIIIGAGGHGKVCADITIKMNKWKTIAFLDDNEIRERVQTELEQKNAGIPNLIHPDAVIRPQVKINCGTVIMAGVIINSDTMIAKGCIINTGTTVDHDNVIEDYENLSPVVNLTGCVNVGAKTWLRIGSRAINNINITNGCKIGAGSVVLKDIIQKGIYVWFPSKKQLS